MKDIHIARGLHLPLDAVTQTFAFLARKGAGKTYTAGKLAEELLEVGAQVVILDPVGIWYGLRLGADKKSPGFPIPVFGGEHGDIPLEHGAGALIADVVIDNNSSAVLDVSNFRKGQRKEFVTSFAEQFFHRKKTKRTPVMLIIEEAQVFAPQRPGKGEERMLGAIEDIVRLGRNYGIGAGLISQRPQSVNKEVLNQVEALFVMQTTGPHERKAINEWVVEKGIDIKEMVDELPSLPVGTAYLWSPQWLGILQKVQILKKKTFDASSTPVLGAKAIKPKKLTPVDLQQIQGAMADLIEKHKADDPRILHARITELERQLKTQPKATIKRVEVPILTKGQINLLGTFKTVIESSTKRMLDGKTTLESAIENSQTILNEIKSIFDAASFVKTPPAVSISTTRTSVVPARSTEAVRTANNNSTVLGRCDRAILTVLAQHDGCDSKKLTLLAGYRFSGGFKNSLSKLRNTGYLVGGNSGTMSITETGQASLGSYDPLPTGQALRDYWLSKFGVCERAILGTLFNHPSGLDKDQLVELTGYRLSGGFKNSLSKLRTAGVIVGRNTEIMRANEELLR